MNVCPVCLGYPGTLPVVNEKAVGLLIKSALALNCNIASYSKFDRKNYFYPDMPKNYQISQYDMPLAEGGFLAVKTDDGNHKKIHIRRIHLEEDAGKIVHKGTIKESLYTLLDYNRAGVPLMEIVTEPDMETPVEAHNFLTGLKAILEWLSVSDCKMEEGSLRCDANISVAVGTRSRLVASDLSLPKYKVEIKNMNSFKSVLRALSYERKRQIELLKNNQPIVHETRGWDEDKQITVGLRSKEETHDYRYFPEPDLLPMEIDKKWIDSIMSEIPELPVKRAERFKKQYNLSEYDAELLNQSKPFSVFFEEAAKLYPNAKVLSNWLSQDVSKILNDKAVTIEESRLTTGNLVKLLNLIDKGVISGKIAKTIIEDVINGADPEAVIREKGLAVISDAFELEKIIDKVLADNAPSVEKYKAGSEKVLGFLVGQIMRETRGKADPGKVNEILGEKLTE